MKTFNRILKPAVFVSCLVPLMDMAWRALSGGLSANPIDDITDWSGTWTLRFLLITLSVTPLRRITGWNGAIRFRRMLGLFAFFYGCLHLTTFVWLDQFFDVGAMIKDIAKRRFITAGMTAFSLMLPLAITSTRKWIARLGGVWWQRLHRLIYFSATAGVIHYLWLVKLDIHRPVIYGILLSLLLGYRIVLAVKARLVSPRPAAARERTVPPPRRLSPET